MTLSRHHLASGPELRPREHPLDVGEELPEPACTLEGALPRVTSRFH